MTSLDKAIQAVQRFVDERGVDEAARLSGLPVSTLYEARRRGFTGRAVKTLQKLVAAAETTERKRARKVA